MIELSKSMFLSLKIKNFKSYKDEAEFTMEAVDNESLSNNYTEIELEGGEIIKVLHTAVILGANASGKSNIVWAFRALSYLVRTSRDFKRNTHLDPYDGFAFNEQTMKEPVEMAIQFILNNVRYEYVIAFDEVIRQETLYSILNDNRATIFYRLIENANDYHHIALGDGWDHPLPDWIKSDIFPNHLILSDIASKQAYELNNINELLSLINVFVNPVNIKYINDNIAPLIIKTSQSDVFKKLVRLIMVADLGVADISMHRHDEKEFSFPDFVSESERQKIIRENTWEFRLYHKIANQDGSGNARYLDLSRESMGTQHLFGLGAMILSILEDGGMLVYDELNTALHPEITRLLVRLFQSPESNPHHAQLVFTTHDASVLGESILRADQVWLAEKDDDSCSHLFSIQDFENVPIVPPMELWYRSGRFGALPNINNIHYIFTGDLKI